MADHSESFAFIKNQYQIYHLFTEEDVRSFVPALITQEEADEILGGGEK